MMIVLFQSQTVEVYRAGWAFPKHGWSRGGESVVFISMANLAKFCYGGGQRRDLMATMNISLPDKMKEWAEAQTASGRYGNTSDYIRDLIRDDQKKAEFVAFIQKAVDAADASGYEAYSREETLKRLANLPR
jgi:antitoxin ParD1/3/4